MVLQKTLKTLTIGGIIKQRPATIGQPGRIVLARMSPQVSIPRSRSFFGLRFQMLLQTREILATDGKVSITRLLLRAAVAMRCFKVAMQIARLYGQRPVARLRQHLLMAFT